MRMTRTALAIPAAALLVGLSLAAFPAAAGAVPSRAGGARAAVDPAVTAQLATGQPLVDVVVVLRQQADLSRITYRNRAERLAGVERELQATAASGQRGVLGYLRGAASQVAAVTPLWISNEVEVKATPAVIRALAARGDVREIKPERTIQAPPRPPTLPIARPAASSSSAATPATGATVSAGATVLAAAAAPEPNIAKINAPALWGLGFTGQGVVVANLDTGVDVTQPDLAGRWRGGSNSWFDPYAQHATPVDVNGHGTWTMGVMVGGDAGGTSVGVAPGATWIAAKIFNDKGAATTTAIHQSFQWLLDPDHNPATADAPNVVNNSWSGSAPGCGLEFQPDLQNLRAAGILPVFAAGNDGPLPGTVFGPANLPPAFAVGGTDNADALYASSSRGPSPCAGATAPKLSAPGVGVRTTDLFGGYTVQTGTSLSSPHVAGALALLLSAFPGTSADRQEAALEAGAVDLGTAGLDNDFGFGRLDVLAAYNWLGSAADFGLAATPNSVTTTPGGVASYALASTGSNSFAGDVSLSLSGLPAGSATWTFTPPVISGGTGTSQLDVTTSATIVPGTYPLTITGTSGTLTHTASASLVIPAPADFTLTAGPASQTVTAGGTAGYTVTAGSVNGFTGNVALSLTGLPAAVGTAGFTPSTIAGAGSSQLSILTAGTAPPGSYPLTVTGTSGTVSHSAAITLVVPSPGDFTVGATPASRTVVAGSATSYTVSVGAVNGFTGDVTLTLGGLPGTVGTASFTPTVVAGGAGSSQLTITTLGTAPAGKYSLTVTGTSGSTVHTAAVTVSVTNFGLSASPSVASVKRGRAATYSVKVTAQNGFTGTVTLSSSGLPAGVTAKWSGNPVRNSGSASLQLTTSSSTPVGTYVLSITGTSGSLTHTVFVTLTVTK